MISSSNKNTKNQDISVLETENNKVIESASDICNAFNNYFATVGCNLANKLPKVANNSCRQSSSVTSLINSSSSSFFLRPISVEEVYLHLISLNPKKKYQIR